MDTRLDRIAEYFVTRNTNAPVDPLTIAPDLLPHIFILAIEHGEPPQPNRLRVRLTGTALDAALGRRLVGHYLDEFIHGPRGAEVLDAFNRCAEDGKPIWMRQVASLNCDALRFVEAVAIRIGHDRLYGGLIVFEWAGKVDTPIFEYLSLRSSSPNDRL